MPKKETNFQMAREQAEDAIRRTNKKIEYLGCCANDLYGRLNSIQELFDKIRNVPSEKSTTYRKLKEVRLNWKFQAEKIERDYKTAAVKNAGGTAAGIGTGIVVAAFGPSAAMGIATTFGVASTGTAISALSGAAATNAALAWLGGGALALGGGGMAAGNALLAFAGPAGLAIAGAALVGSSLMAWKNRSDQKKLEDIYTLISRRDAKTYELASVEIDERIIRIKNENALLADAMERIQSFGLNYEEMSLAQQYELGSYVNLMESSTQLLVNPILGLQPKYTEIDFDQFVSTEDSLLASYHTQYKKVLISLANLFYKIDLDMPEIRLLVHSFKKNKEFLNAMEIEKKEMDQTLLKSAILCLRHKYGKE